jgi:hypothetical protein
MYSITRQDRERKDIISPMGMSQHAVFYCRIVSVIILSIKKDEP